MTDHPAFRVACFVVGISMLGLAAFGLLWAYSSSSLAFRACGGEFSFFAEQFRCRQPHLAWLLMAVALALSGVAFFCSLRPRGWLDGPRLPGEDGA